VPEKAWIEFFALGTIDLNAVDTIERKLILAIASEKQNVAF